MTEPLIRRLTMNSLTLCMIHACLTSVSKDAVFLPSESMHISSFKYFKQLKTTTRSCWLTEIFLSQYALFLGPFLCAAWSTMCFFLILRIKKPFWKAQNRHLSHAHTYAVAWHVFKHSIIKKIY